MAKTANVSVVIPCYNAEKTILRALDSIVDQTLLPKEVIIVDDKSIDHSCDIIKNYIKEQEKRVSIKLIELDKNAGPAKARNVGWDNAKEDYIAFLDADDSWHPQKIALQYSYMEDHPDIAMSGHLYKIVHNRPTLCKKRVAKVERISKRKLLVRNRLSTPTVMLKRIIPFRFRENKKYSEDYRLWLEILFAEYKASFLYSNLCFLYKNTYGSSGLSSSMMNMWYGELDNYKFLYTNNDINLLEYIFVLLLSFFKFLKRQIFIVFRNFGRKS